MLPMAGAVSRSSWIEIILDVSVEGRGPNVSELKIQRELKLACDAGAVWHFECC